MEGMRSIYEEFGNIIVIDGKNVKVSKYCIKVVRHGSVYLFLLFSRVMEGVRKTREWITKNCSICRQHESSLKNSFKMTITGFIGLKYQLR
jgi:hypothetical protein